LPKAVLFTREIIAVEGHYITVQNRQFCWCVTVQYYDTTEASTMQCAHSEQQLLWVIF